MAEDNGTEWRQRIERRVEELETDSKILLRAQVLQADKQGAHGDLLDRIERSLEGAIEQGKAIDGRIDKLVSAVGALAGKVEFKQN